MVQRTAKKTIASHSADLVAVLLMIALLVCPACSHKEGSSASSDKALADEFAAKCMPSFFNYVRRAQMHGGFLLWRGREEEQVINSIIDDMKPAASNKVDEQHGIAILFSLIDEDLLNEAKVRCKALKHRHSSAAAANKSEQLDPKNIKSYYLIEDGGKY